MAKSRAFACQQHNTLLAMDTEGKGVRLASQETTPPTESSCSHLQDGGENLPPHEGMKEDRKQSRHTIHFMIEGREMGGEDSPFPGSCCHLVNTLARDGMEKPRGLTSANQITGSGVSWSAISLCYASVWAEALTLLALTSLGRNCHLCTHPSPCPPSPAPAGPFEDPSSFKHSSLSHGLLLTAALSKAVASIFSMPFFLSPVHPLSP